MSKITRWFGSQYQKYLRVWRLLRKPSMAELKLISKVTAIGLLVIGALGFIISIILEVVL
ncbi:MAG: protein translocase SEC61 complex subunit gamma [archaeon]